MPSKKSKRRRLSQEGFVIDAVKKIENDGIKNASTADLLLFVSSRLNEEMDELNESLTQEMRTTTNAINSSFNKVSKFFLTLCISIIAGIVVYIVMNVINTFLT